MCVLDRDKGNSKDPAAGIQAKESQPQKSL